MAVPSLLETLPNTLIQPAIPFNTTSYDFLLYLTAIALPVLTIAKICDFCRLNEQNFVLFTVASCLTTWPRNRRNANRLQRRTREPPGVPRYHGATLRLIGFDDPAQQPVLVLICKIIFSSCFCWFWMLSNNMN